MASIGINKVILAGNIGKDPEVRYLEGGIVKATFPLATTEHSKDKNGNRVDHTEWHNIVLWRAKSEYAEKYLKKGYAVLVEGKLRTRQWEDKDKNKRSITEIQVESINLLHTPKKEEHGNQSNLNTGTTDKNYITGVQHNNDSTSQT
jgi:single-strand DNA-binding protein